MKTLFVPLSPTPTSPAFNFRTDAQSSNEAVQGEVSPSDTNARIDRDTRRLIHAATLAAVAALWLGLRYPLVLAMIVCISGSAALLIAAILWQGHRGDAEIGVADTQGRDGGNHG